MFDVHSCVRASKCSLILICSQGFRKQRVAVMSTSPGAGQCQCLRGPRSSARGVSRVALVGVSRALGLRPAVSPEWLWSVFPWPCDPWCLVLDPWCLVLVLRWAGSAQPIPCRPLLRKLLVAFRKVFVSASVSYNRHLRFKTSSKLGKIGFRKQLLCFS